MKMFSWFACFRPRMKRKSEVVVQKEKPKLKDLFDQKSKQEQPSSSANPGGASPDPDTETDPMKRVKSFTYRELATATNNFKPESMIGRGGFGAVFKGTLPSTGKIVAVKMHDPSGQQGDKEFLVEALMLALYRHEYLVKLYGYCAEGDQRLLVYEYMPFGSVEDLIHYPGSGGVVLDFSTRMKIALGAAKGLEYLHNEAQPSVIYRDLKTANILLDHGYKPKLSDFGLAKLGPNEDEASHVSTRVMGTLGYCAPEYATTGRLTLMSDIYSFGVVLLELITGRKPMGDSTIGSKRLLVQWVWPLLINNNIEEIVDPRLSIQDHPYMKKAVKSAVVLAYRCLREEAHSRPKISKVVHDLDVLVGYIARKQMEESIGECSEKEIAVSEKSPTGVLSGNEIEEVEDEEDEVLKRKRAVAEAKKWAAEALRASQGKGKEPVKKC